MKELVKQLSDFSYRSGYEVGRVFDDFLRYIINGFTVPGYPGLPDWHYKDEENRAFYSMVQTLTLALQKEIYSKGWFDAFGHIYEDLIASKSRRSNSGQFFTPETLCDLMTEITYPNEKIVGKLISDPTCGSGRTLLSFHAKHPGNRYIAEDIDKTCTMMTVCNFLFHGVEGEVVWHDSLNPDSFFGAWKVNEGLNNPFHKFFGIPHIEPIGEYKDTKLRKMYDNREKSIRITTKLKASAEKQLATFKTLKRKRVLTEEEKRQASHLLKRYRDLMRMIKKYK